MRYMRLALAAICVAAVGTGLAAAAPRDMQRNPSPPMGNNPHPVFRGGQPARPALRPSQRPTPRPSSRPSVRPSQPSVRPSQPANANRQRYDNRNRNTNVNNANRVYYLGGSYLLGNAFGYLPYYSYGYPCYYNYPFVYYSPQVVPRHNADLTEPPDMDGAIQRATNAESVARGQTFIGYGDALFARGKYAEANDRYRKAAEAAPQLADALFRQGFALTATGRYDLAVRAIKRGLALDPTWPESGFALDELYQGNAAAKGQHFDLLAAAAQKRPNDADLLFLVGVYFYFDGQAARAAPFFQLAAQLAGGNAEYIVPFLAK